MMTRQKRASSFRQKCVFKNAPRSLREKKPEPRSGRAPERSGGIALLVPLPFVSPTHPLARAVDDRDVDFLTAREKYSHPPREPRTTDESRSRAPKLGSKVLRIRSSVLLRRSRLGVRRGQHGELLPLGHVRALGEVVVVVRLDRVQDVTIDVQRGPHRPPRVGV